MKKLIHENVVQMYDYEIYQYNNSQGQIMNELAIIYEYANQLSLQQFV